MRAEPPFLAFYFHPHTVKCSTWNSDKQITHATHDAHFAQHYALLWRAFALVPDVKYILGFLRVEMSQPFHEINLDYVFSHFHLHDEFAKLFF